MFDAVAFQAMRRSSWGSHLDWHLELPSTQDALRDKIRQGPCEPGTVVGCETQSAGRGRWGRTWEDQAGQSLLFTVAIPCGNLQGTLSQAPLVLGLGLHQALSHLGLAHVALRWPNDLTWQGRKIAGLLTEQEGDFLLAGFGLNVGQNAEVFSPEIRSKAASLRMAACPELRREPLLAAILVALEAAWSTWQTDGFEPIRMGWEASAEGVGALLQIVPTSGQAWTGRWSGLHSSGALQLVPEAGGPPRLVASGEVQRLLFP